MQNDDTFTFGDLRSYIARVDVDCLLPDTHRKIWHKIFTLPLGQQEAGASYFKTWYQSQGLFQDTFKCIAMPAQERINSRLLPYLEGIEGVYAASTQLPYLPQSCKYAHLGSLLGVQRLGIYAQLSRKDVLYSICAPPKYRDSDPSGQVMPLNVEHTYIVRGHNPGIGWSEVSFTDSSRERRSRGSCHAITYLHALRDFDRSLLYKSIKLHSLSLC